MLIFPMGSTAACQYAVNFLNNSGVAITDHPAPEVTHLLLDVPSFATDGMLRGGGDVQSILERLPENITIIGGNLTHPALDGYRKEDLLQNPQYLASNAAITADCALQTAAPKLTTTFAGSPALIIGWGRIGKCLGQLLKAVGADVTIAARKETDRAMICALGLKTVDICGISAVLPRCRLIFNTVPEQILYKKDLTLCKNCIKIDLASKPGIEGEDVIWARGLPGIYAPESSGRLIAETILKRFEEGLK